MGRGVVFNEDICGDLKNALEKEWLETNTFGTYASSSIINVNTRSSHGLFVSGADEIHRHMVLLAKLEEQVIVGGDTFYLSCNFYPHAIQPTGFLYLKQFVCDPFPTFIYKLDEVTIEKKVLLFQDQNTLGISYRIISGGTEVILKIRPLLAYRMIDTFMKFNDKISRIYSLNGSNVHVRPYDKMQPLFFKHDGVMINGTAVWYHNFIYKKDRELGVRGTDDLFNPFEVNYCLNNSNNANLLVSDSDISGLQIEDALSKEIERRIDQSLSDSNLSISAKAFNVLKTKSSAFLDISETRGLSFQSSVPRVDGGPAEKMISLAGLFLVNGQYDNAAELLKEQASEFEQTSVFLGNESISQTDLYGQVFAALYFFRAAHQYLEYTNDTPFLLNELFEVMLKKIRFFTQSENSTVGVRDGFLFTHKQDADDIFSKLSGNRQGCLIELNALFYFALKFTVYLASLKKKQDVCEELYPFISELKNSFEDVFWNAEKGSLYDCIDGDFKDDSVRFFQLYAVSLPVDLLLPEKRRSVVENVRSELLTMYGLRTLSREHPAYVGVYSGDKYSRELSFQQGTVWPWTIGVFMDAYYKAKSGLPGFDKDCEGILRSLFHHTLYNGGIGFVSEIFDGDYPHKAKGHIAHACNSAELMRVYHEYVKGNKKSLLLF